MSRGVYRSSPTEHSLVHSLAVLGLGYGIGWLWFGSKLKRLESTLPPVPKRPKRTPQQGPDVADIEAVIRARGVDPRYAGLSGR